MDSVKYLPYSLGLILVIYELVKPIHKTTLKESLSHYVTNLSLYFLTKIILIFLVPVIIGVFEIYEIGLLQLFRLHSIIETIISLLLLDFFVWLQHYLTHEINFLWRLHRVHHSDTLLDCSSAIRFHPIELILSLFYKVSLCILLGISLKNYFLFETILVTFAIFGHSNSKLNQNLSKFLGLVFITPELHQIHHSNKNKEMNSNFGTIFNIWDRLFGKFLETKDIENNFKLGLNGVERKKAQSLSFLFTYPFK
ncbi:sterol desaturase family protein [Bacteriovorax sp. Seq25_V]|uniref:sterol desaturase family protein n=1 Tax=Bacteriovorax sp. Seq25_V TaxID=1201288 RepID=UPI00038A04DD|nr:sterol desaturase family protein [Bacteriovorax sp. Seq25_V]EQC46059.1 fatty acid hydroxylase family protein [Bacteriovorax sp. Seq25_V]